MSPLEWIKDAATTLEADLRANAGVLSHFTAAAEIDGCPHHPHGHHHLLCPVVFPGHEEAKMWCFSAGGYNNTEGYCMGDDDISRTLINQHHWEGPESRVFHRLLANTSGIVIDFGAHIGWYSTMAVRMGRLVLAVEGMSEHITLVKRNAKLNGYEDSVVVAHCWVDDKTPTIGAPIGTPQIAMVKIDLEGNDGHAINAIWPLIEAGFVRNIMIEVSPCFNDGYPDLLRLIMGMGYSAEVIAPWQPFEYSEIDAVVAQAPQVDMMLVKR